MLTTIDLKGRKSYEFIQACLSEFKNATDAITEQLNLIKAYILAAKAETASFLMEHFGFIEDIVFDQFITVKQYDDLMVSQQRHFLEAFSKDVKEYVHRTGLDTYESVSQQTEVLTEFVIYEKEKIMDFGEDLFRELMTFIHENGVSSVEILQNELRHVSKAILVQYEEISDILQMDCAEIERQAYEAFQRCQKLVDDEILQLECLPVVVK